MKAVIDRDGCIGCALCTELCPEVFRMADNGLAEAYADITAETAEAAQQAAQSCPVSVIEIEG